MARPCGRDVDLGEEAVNELRRRGAGEPQVKRLGRRLPADEENQEHEAER